jgi:NTP pyrophosphatase (non-canonical NTP hydrolase)
MKTKLDQYVEDVHARMKSDMNINEEYVGWANTLDSAGEDSTLVRERLDEETVAWTMIILGMIKSVGDSVDQLKKFLYYGKRSENTDYTTKGVIDVMLREIEYDSQAHSNLVLTKNRLNDHEVIRLLHAILGIAGEVGELAQPLMDYLVSGVPIDQTNIAEEVGDSLWYHALIAKYQGLDELSPYLMINKDKLTKRYGTKWSKQGATERDLKAEREILERGQQEFVERTGEDPISSNLGVVKDTPEMNYDKEQD